jgi:hypothetical protein
MFLLYALCVFVLSLGAPTPGHAQPDSVLSDTDQQPTFPLALRGGVALTNFDYSVELAEGETSEWITGWMFGLDGRVPITATWWFESGFHVVRKGSRSGYTGPGEILGFPVYLDLEETASLTYIVVPARLKLMSKSRIKPYARLGLDFGILVRATSHVTGTITGNAGTAPIDEKGDVKDQVKDVELALAMEMGVEGPLGGARAFLELRGNLGVTDVDTDGVAKSQAVGIAFGVAFPVNR